MEHINDKHENFAAQFLIQEHTVGSIRDLSDFHNIKYHIRKTICFTKDIIENFEGTNEEKCIFLDKILLDIEKFKVK